MCLVHSTRCRPGLTLAGNIPLRLLWCTSLQGVGRTVGWGIYIYVFDGSLARRELITNICQGLFDRCVEYSKRLYFCQLALFLVFLIAVLARDIWPMIDSVGAVQGFLSQLWSSVAFGSRICSSSFFCLVTLFRVGDFLSVAYLTVANLARLGISVHC